MMALSLPTCPLGPRQQATPGQPHCPLPQLAANLDSHGAGSQLEFKPWSPLVLNKATFSFTEINQLQMIKLLYIV